MLKSMMDMHGSPMPCKRTQVDRQTEGEAVRAWRFGIEKTLTRLTVGEPGQRLGMGPPEPGAETRGEDDDLGLHELLLGCPVVEPVETRRDPTSQ